MMKQINNNIEEARVNFENAKLLKAAGFGCTTDKYYVTIIEPDKSNFEFTKEDWNSLSYHNNPTSVPFEHFTNIKAPTIQTVVEWIRVNFYKFIVINTPSGSEVGGSLYSWTITNFDKKGYLRNVYSTKVEFEDEEEESKFQRWFKTPQEAYQAAITYTLTNLINNEQTK